MSGTYPAAIVGDGENPRAALERELHGELGIVTRRGRCSLRSHPDIEPPDGHLGDRPLERRADQWRSR